MNRLSRDEVTRHMSLTADELYALVSDVTLTPQWSREVISCQWVDPATAGQPGAVFVARNRRSWFTWSNRPVLEVAEPGREFTFRRTERGGGTMRWSYRFAATGSGTDVTLSYEATDPVPVGLHLILRLFGVPDLQADLHDNLETSLERLDTYAQRESRRATP